MSIAGFWIGHDYVSIYDNKQGSENLSYNTYREMTLQVNEYVLQDKHISNLTKDIRFSALEK